MEQHGSSQADISELHQQTTSDVQQLDEPQQGSGSSGNSSSNGRSSSSSGWRQRLIRYSIKVIQAVLLIEFAAIVVQPLLPAGSKSKEAASDSDEQDIDPADILMDYFTGRRGITALQLLDNKQLRQAVDNLVTEDFQELGVKDRGSEIREIVEDVIRVREEGPRPPKEERVGLGKIGPLKFRNSRPAASKAAVADAQ